MGVETSATGGKIYSIGVLDREGFKGCIIEVPQPLDTKRVKLLERLGGIVHQQVQMPQAPAIILVPVEAFENLVPKTVLTQEGQDLEGTVLGSALAVSSGVRNVLEGDK